MDPKYTGEMMRHLEKQNELLVDAYKSMTHELHRLQVEEEMLMRKFYELMSAQGLTKKNEGGNDVPGGGDNEQANAVVHLTPNE